MKEIYSRYDHEESCHYGDPREVEKLVFNAKEGLSEALNDLHKKVKNGSIEEAVYFDAKKGYNESMGRDRNFMVPDEFRG